MHPTRFGLTIVRDNPGTGVNEGYGVVELVPEPASSFLLAGALFALWAARRGRRP